MKIKHDLIKLGQECPEIRQHIKKVFEKLATTDVVPLSAPNVLSKNASVLPFTLDALLAALQAAYHHYQVAHWTVGGVNFYADHLMYQRMYEAILENIDTLAEKIVGSGYTLNGVLLNQMKTVWLNKWEHHVDLNHRSLQVESDLLRFIADIRESMEDGGTLTLGMDDFLASTASLHEEHVYLIRQRLS